MVIAEDDRAVTDNDQQIALGKYKNHRRVDGRDPRTDKAGDKSTTLWADRKTLRWPVMDIIICINP